MSKSAVYKNGKPVAHVAIFSGWVHCSRCGKKLFPVDGDGIEIKCRGRIGRSPCNARIHIPTKAIPRE